MFGLIYKVWSKLFARFIRNNLNQVVHTLDRIICLLCVYICHYIFPFYYLDILFYSFLTHWDRKHYYIKVVESIQFVCARNSGISRVLCKANTYRSIHEWLFFNSNPALGLEYPLRLPYIHFYFYSLHLQYKINGIIHKYFNQSDWLLYFSGRRGECQTTRPADNSDRGKGLVGP
jgi:hypothetical protein